MVGTADSVLIREVSLSQGVLYREVPLLMYCPCVCSFVHVQVSTYVSSFVCCQYDPSHQCHSSILLYVPSLSLPSLSLPSLSLSSPLPLPPLPSPSSPLPGKHNGTVQGVKYFKCKQGHGVFVRQEKLVRDTTSSPSHSPRLSGDQPRRSVSGVAGGNVKRSASGRSSLDARRVSLGVDRSYSGRKS